MESLGYQSCLVVENTLIARDVYRLRVEGDTSPITAPGQFAQLKVDGFYLPRPISICDWDEKETMFIYKVVGQGTKALSKMLPGQKIEILTGLGNGFDVKKAGEINLLAGGGLGVAPLYGLAKRLGKGVVALGFQSESDVFLKEEFEKLGFETRIATVDGTMGHQGFVTGLMEDLSGAQVFACGPEPMLKAVHKLYPTGQYSFEARMACGVGACMGCTCHTKLGAKRVCADGPVFGGEEIQW